MNLVDNKPAMAAGTLTAIPAAVVTLLVALDVWHPSTEEQAMFTGALTVLIMVLAKFVASVVYCRDTVKTLLPASPPVAPPAPPNGGAVVQPPTVGTGAVTGGTPESLEAAIRAGKVPPFPPPPPPTP